MPSFFTSGNRRCSCRRDHQLYQNREDLSEERQRYPVIWDHCHFVSVCSDQKYDPDLRVKIYESRKPGELGNIPTVPPGLISQGLVE